MEYRRSNLSPIINSGSPQAAPQLHDARKLLHSPCYRVFPRVAPRGAREISTAEAAPYDSRASHFMRLMILAGDARPRLAGSQSIPARALPILACNRSISRSRSAVPSPGSVPNAQRWVALRTMMLSGSAAQEELVAMKPPAARGAADCQPAGARPFTDDCPSPGRRPEIRYPATSTFMLRRANS
jgi:hypothetical protein